jgi:hypothetical protein
VRSVPGLHRTALGTIHLARGVHGHNGRVTAAFARLALLRAWLWATLPGLASIRLALKACTSASGAVARLHAAVGTHWRIGLWVVVAFTATVVAATLRSRSPPFAATFRLPG